MRENKGFSRKKVWLTMVGIFILLIFAIGIIYPQYPDQAPLAAWFNKFTPKLGLDLQGGAHLVYQADLSQVSNSDAGSALEGVRDVIERRVNAFGVAEPLVQTSSHDRLIVELAGVFDVNEAIKQIGETPLLEFKTENPAYSQPPPLTAEQQKQLDDFNTAAQEKAESLIQQLDQGADFAELAQANSDDPGSASQGGELGWAKKGSYVPEFETALWDNLEDGEYTKVAVESDFGYHIIFREASRGEGDQAEVQARHILIKTQRPSDIVPLPEQWLNTDLTGKNLQSAAVVFDPQTSQPEVSLKFDDAGKELFAQLTRDNVGKPIAIFLDGQPISVPLVNEEITQGEAVIQGNFQLPEAKLLTQRLNAGALPVPIELISQQTIGPSLGKISLQQSLLAGLLGLLLVGIFMLVFYRLPGILAVLALVIYTIIALAIFELIPITLTLAGIAGFILSVGMAVDANVLIFERMREELRWGKPMGTAVEEGFKRAWAPIRDSNISSLITCLILIWFGTSIIKGFAITLGIGILVSMFSAITVTRTLMRLLVKRGLTRHLWLFNVSKKIKENV
ncbi:MAG: protein translocase subunit SecD [Candidatus Komeilibacteria bacterium]